MRLCLETAVLVAFLTVWYTWQQVDMKDKFAANNQTWGSHQKHFPHRGKHFRGAPVNEQGQRSYGLVAPGSYQHAPIYNQNAQGMTYPLPQAQFPNGSQYQAVMQGQPVGPGYNMQPSNLPLGQNFVVQPTPEAPVPMPNNQNFTQAPVYFPMPTMGPPHQFAGASPQVSFAVPPPSLPVQSFPNPSQQGIPQQRHSYGTPVPRQVYHADNVAKPPLFVNHQVIQPGSVFTNSDGYTERYTTPESAPSVGYSSQPVVYDQYEGKRKQQRVPDNSTTQDKLMQLELSSVSSASQDNETPPDSPDLEAPEVVELGDTSDQKDEPIGADQTKLIPTLEAFKFDGTNFPVVSKTTGPIEEYDSLLNTITDSIKQFFRTREELWFLADTKTRVPTENYEFLDEPLSPDEGFAFNSESMTPAPENRAESPFSAASNSSDREDMVYIDHFLPVESLKVPLSSFKENEKSGLYHGNNQNCLLLDNPKVSVIEKHVTKDILEKSSESAYLPIEFRESEKERIFSLLRSGLEATIVLYAELPSDQQNAENAESATRPDTTEQELPTGGDSSSANGRSEPQLLDNRHSRSTNGITNQPPNRGRSSSNFDSVTFSRNSRSCPWDPRAYNLPESGTPVSGDFPRHIRSGSNRKLPALPQQYLNGQGTSSSTSSDRSWAEVVSAESRSGLESRPRRRHQSQDGVDRVQSEQYPQPWMNEHAHLRFIIPTERQLMAQLPFPPFRMPLIGVARREPGQPYVPHRVLPAHENFDLFRLRMRELQDATMPTNRGNGALLLEPRGFLDQRMMNGDDGEVDTEVQSPSEEDGAEDNTKQEMVDECDNLKKRALLEQEEARKRRETASTCRNVSPFLRYHHGSSDDDDDEGSGRPTCSSAFPSSDSATCSSATTSSSTDPNTAKGTSSSYPSKSAKNRSELKQRPVRNTATKNQKRRERDQRRALRKEEEMIQKKKLEEEARIKKEKRAAELKRAKEEWKMEQEELAKRRAIEEEERIAQEQKNRILEEEREAEIEKEKAEKRRLMNLLNKEKKKASKQNKYEAAKKLKEEEAKQLRLVRKLLTSDMQHDFDMAILSKLALAKNRLDQNEKLRVKTTNTPDSCVIKELENSKETDSKTISERL